MLLRTTHFLPREPAEREFLLKSSRALARGVLLGEPGSPKTAPAATWLTPVLHQPHGRPSGQEYRLRLKRPSSIFCNMFIYSTLWMYDLAVTQFSLAFSTNPIDGGRQFDRACNGFAVIRSDSHHA
jgi:hypothetical protein